jgi:hypothetical protein
MSINVGKLLHEVWVKILSLVIKNPYKQACLLCLVIVEG